MCLRKTTDRTANRINKTYSLRDPRTGPFFLHPPIDRAANQNNELTAYCLNRR